MLKDYGRLLKDGELKVKAHSDNKSKTRSNWLIDSYISSLLLELPPVFVTIISGDNYMTHIGIMLQNNWRIGFQTTSVGICFPAFTFEDSILGQKRHQFYLSIYISTYIAPLQGNYSEALPAQARPNRRVLRSL